MQGLWSQQSFIGVPAFDPHIKLKRVNYYNNKEQKKEYISFFKSARKTSPFSQFHKIKTVDEANKMKSHFENLLQSAPKNPFIVFSLYQYIHSYHFYSIDLQNDFADYDLQTMLALNDYWGQSLGLDLPEKVKIELRKWRMMDYKDLLINDSIDSRLDYLTDLENESTTQTGSETDQQWLTLKKVRDADFKATSGFIPNDGFFGLNFGYVGYSRDSVNYFHGLEVSYDRVLDENPLNNPLRFSPFGIVFTRNLQKNQSEVLFKSFEVKNCFLIRANVIQFGFNSGIANQAKWFYRPEFGIDLGVMGITYAYNLAFDKAYRDLMGRHQLLISYSYPLVRIGKYK
jgi:hypothetical protein